MKVAVFGIGGDVVDDGIHHNGRPDGPTPGTGNRARQAAEYGRIDGRDGDIAGICRDVRILNYGFGIVDNGIHRNGTAGGEILGQLTTDGHGSQHRSLLGIQGHIPAGKQRAAFHPRRELFHHGVNGNSRTHGSGFGSLA